MSKKKREFMALYDPVHNQFERFCKARAYGQMDFKDLMQQTVLFAYENFESIRNKEAFLSFLFGSSVKILANANRKIREQDWNDNLAGTTRSLDRSDKSLEIEDLYSAINQLSEPSAQAIVLFEISGFTIREIAGIQSCTEAAVRQRLSRARKELMELLKDEPVLEQQASA